MQDKILTYGEAHTFVMMSDWIVQGDTTKSIPLPQHYPRMNQYDAMVYYKDKLHNEFIKLGYTYKSKQVNNALWEKDHYLRTLAKVRRDRRAMINREAIKINKELVA